MYFATAFSLLVAVIPLVASAPAPQPDATATTGSCGTYGPINSLVYADDSSWRPINAGWVDSADQSINTCQKMFYDGMVAPPALQTTGSSPTPIPSAGSADTRFAFKMNAECKHCKMYTCVNPIPLSPISPGLKRFLCNVLTSFFVAISTEDCNGDVNYLSDENGYEVGIKDGKFHDPMFLVNYPVYKSFRC